MNAVDRAQVIAERDAQIIAWLGKKAAEFGSSNRDARAKAEAVGRMADKLSRGAVRDDETGLSELYRLRAENNQLRNDITGACLARYEEERENARLRLAWQSARERAQAYSEGNLRHVADRDTWMGWAKEAQAEVQRLQAERHSTNEALSDAAEQLRVQRDRITELEADLKKYVGVEPTVAEELAYVNGCLNAVYAVCDAAEKQATRWENPLPVPEWVVLVRNAADGVTINAPALPPVPQQRQSEDAHTSELPTIPRQTTGRCPQGHTFEDCTCGSAG